MIDARLIEGRLSSIRHRLARIRERLPATRQEFLDDADSQELVTFNLFLAFQDAIDVAAHIIVEREWPVPSTNREHFDLLGAHGMITRSTAASMAGCAGLRNLIAHTYGSLDLERLYEELPAGIQSLEAFCAEIAET